MSRLATLAVCAAVLSTSGGAQALAAPPAAAAPSHAALDCAKRYNKAMRLEATMAAMMKALIPAMTEQSREQGRPADPERDRLILDAIVEVAVEMTPAIMDALAPVMVASFTEAEVCGLADFYESPVGQGVVDKMPAFSTASGKIMTEIMPGMQVEMLRRVCAKVDCGAMIDPKRPTRTDS